MSGLGCVVLLCLIVNLMGSVWFPRKWFFPEEEGYFLEDSFSLQI